MTATVAATAMQPAPQVVLRPGVVDLVQAEEERALTVELTLEFGCLVVKHACVFAGAGEPENGYSRVRVGDVDVWWRQRLNVPGRDLSVAPTVRPRRVVVSRVGRALSAEATYA